MNIVIPMAGRGSRFADSGVTVAKPLIPVDGRPMLSWALQSLADVACSQMVFIALEEHEAAYGVRAIVRDIAGPDAKTILLGGVTEGQLCTVLAARDVIDCDEPVLIASSDTFVDAGLGQCLAAVPRDCQGVISVADMPGDRWSFARTDGNGRVVEVAEKTRISNHASTGLYYFASGNELVATADEMIDRREKTRGEYYVMPVYQKLIERGCRIDICVAREMWDMGTPEALAAFLQHLSSRK